MNANTTALTLQGPVGILQGLLDLPTGEQPPVGTALICHPHPLFGGTMNNKVVQTLARAFVQAGWRSVRFNFRGVEGSAGSYGEGLGEQDDLRAVLAQTVSEDEPLCLAGFSFGAYVASSLLAELLDAGAQERIKATVLVGAAASRFTLPIIASDFHERLLVIHGEEDDTVPLISVLDWARPQHLPVTVIPGVEHFFHGQLPLLKRLTLGHLHSMRL